MWLCALLGTTGIIPQLRAATGCSCTLVWNASPTAGIAGYAVYYGVYGSADVIRYDAGQALSAAIPGLAPATTYVFRVVVYDAYGDESPPSNGLLYATPAISLLQLGVPANGAVNIQFQLVPNASCSVEYTPSLNPPTWTVLTNAVADTSGLASIYDMVDPSQPLRFYRGVTAQPPPPVPATSGLAPSLRWDTSLIPGTVGYTIYYGPVRSSVTNQLDVGSALSATIYGLIAETRYFFYVVPYNASGGQSPPSKSVLYKTPSIHHSSEAKARSIFIPWKRKPSKS